MISQAIEGKSSADSHLVLVFADRPSVMPIRQGIILADDQRGHRALCDNGRSVAVIDDNKINGDRFTIPNLTPEPDVLDTYSWAMSGVKFVSGDFPQFIRAVEKAPSGNEKEKSKYGKQRIRNLEPITKDDR
jgi:hypothetical protein